MSTLLQAAKAFAKANPTRDRGTWSQWCGSLMFRFNAHDRAYATVGDALTVTKIRNGMAVNAPVGAFHLFTKPDHVMQDLTGGGRACFTASAHLTDEESWGDGIGAISVSEYMARTGAKYKGWATAYGISTNTSRPASDLGQTVKPATAPAKATLAKARVRRVAAYLNGRAAKLRRKPTTAVRNGIPGPRYWALVQAAGKADGLYGRGYIINGIPGRRTRIVETVYAARAK